jgi:hypothetical protein
MATSMVNSGAVRSALKKLFPGSPMVIIQASKNPAQTSMGTVIPTKRTVIRIAYQKLPSVSSRA